MMGSQDFRNLCGVVQNFFTVLVIVCINSFTFYPHTPFKWGGGNKQNRSQSVYREFPLKIYKLSETKEFIKRR